MKYDLDKLMVPHLHPFHVEEKTPTAPYDKVVFGGVTIWSRYSKQDELQFMADVVAGCHPVRQQALEIFCNSKMSHDWSLIMRHGECARAVAHAFSMWARARFGGYNAINLFDVSRKHLLELPADWREP